MIQSDDFGLVDRVIKYNLRRDPNYKFDIFKSSPETLEAFSIKKTLTAFRKAAEQVPSYRKFLRVHSIASSDINNIADFNMKVPPTSKEEYVLSSPSIASMCREGQLTKASLLVRSSGYSGKPCTWAKSKDEEIIASDMTAAGLSMLCQIDEKSTLIINAFYLGSWVSGITVSKTTDKLSPVINTGPNKEEIVELLIEFSDQFSQFIVCGYPPFIKVLVDHGIEKKFDWTKIKITFLCGGESFSESWRSDIANKLGVDPEYGRILSVFGASDLGIGGIEESPDCAKIRRLATNNPELAKRLFGPIDTTPMLFQYNPIQYYISVNEKSELLISTIDLEVLQPLIKYNLHDQGGVISCSKMNQILEKFGLIFHLAPFPFVYIIGRSNGAISLSGFLIYPDNVKEALFSNRYISEKVSGKFKMEVVSNEFGNPELHIVVELNERTPLDNQIQQYVQQYLETQLKRLNKGYYDVSRAMPETTGLRVTLSPNRMNETVKYRYI